VMEKYLQPGNSNQPEKDSCVGESVNECVDDPAIVILLTDDTSIHQCLALPTVPTLPGIMPLQTRYERNL